MLLDIICSDMGAANPGALLSPKNECSPATHPQGDPKLLKTILKIFIDHNLLDGERILKIYQQMDMVLLRPTG